MTTDLFHREAEVVVDGLRIHGLRVQFKSTKSLGKEPNTLDMSITGLSASTRAQMKAKHAKVVLLAGFRDALSQVFAGDARTTSHAKKSMEWETRLQCGDGERAYQFARVNESFAAGSRVRDVVRKLAKALGVGMGNAEKALSGAMPSGLEEYSAGAAFYGKASAELDKVLKAAGFEWSIQDGALQVLKVGAVAEGRAVVLSPDSGLVGSPEVGAPQKEGASSVIKAKSLLQPSILPGGTVELRAMGFPGGQYRVTKVTHSGDTAGGTWHSDVEMTPR